MRDDKEDKKSKIINLFKDGAKPRTSSKPTSVKQMAVGNGNIQISGDVGRITLEASKKVVVKYQYPLGTIGANPTLKSRIESMINELGLRREKRFQKSAYAVIRSNLKKDFGISKSEKWTSIWEWPESRASELIDYFAVKLDKTIDGKIQKSAQKPNYKHTRGQLFRMEKEYLDLLGFKADSPEIKNIREKMFGSSSRKDMSDSQFRNWVEILKKRVQEVHGTDF